MASKDSRVLATAVREAGGEVRRSKGGHFKVFLDGRYVTTFPHTASDHRALRNARAALRRAGLDVK